jgi:aryl-alcohol dehydrogenase-like predicted oxidoreductase
MKNLILGSWGLAGESFVGQRPTGYGELKIESVNEVLIAAHDAGINLIDTAPNYGNGNGYKRLINWQNETGKKFELIVKIGRVVKDESVISYQNIEELLELSNPLLEEYTSIKYLFIKDPPKDFVENGLLFEQLSTLNKLYPSIKIGFSTHLNQSLTKLPRIPKGQFIIELEYNAINYLTIHNLVSKLDLKGWEIWGMQALCSGFLTGKYNALSQFASDDWRSNLAASTIRTYCLLSESFHSTFLADHQISHPIRAALFCILNPALKSIVIGPKSIDQFNDFILANKLSESKGIQDYYTDFIAKQLGEY